MTKQTEAIKLALGYITQSGFQTGVNEVITALREALAEQPAQQEPVAWIVEDQIGERLEWASYAHSCHGVPTFPLYTTPPTQRTWVGLTDKDIEAAMPGGIYDCLADPWDCGVGDGDYMRSIKNDVVRIARAIETKLKEKNT